MGRSRDSPVCSRQTRMTLIRLDQRATIIIDDLRSARASDPQSAKRVYDEVKDADTVIDSSDRIIKDKHGVVPRGATMNDIENARIVRG